jgi:hypothetical protein
MAYLRRGAKETGVRIRQLALVASDLEPAVDALCDVLGLEVCYRDPGVGVFGLHNALMVLGDQFLEVVSPLEEGTSAGRLLERRRGDGGYMVILQTRDLEAHRRRLARLGVRIVWETKLDDIATIHLHPRDVGAAIVSLDEARPPGSWRWAGPDWARIAPGGGVNGIAGAALQSDDPAGLAARWAEVLDREVRSGTDGDPAIALEGGALRFVVDRDGRGEGLAEIDVFAPDPERVLAAARRRGLAVGGASVDLCGTRFRLLAPR